MRNNKPNPKWHDPRVVGGRYRSRYWGSAYEVLAIEFDPFGFLRSVTERDDDGVVRTHCTAWDRSDIVLSQPESVAG